MSQPKTIDRIFAVFLVGLTFALLWILLSVIAAQPARSATLLIGPAVPTVSGIEAAPPADYTRGPTIGARPGSRAIELWEPAPPNGCDSPAFAVVSGPRAQRRCYGQD